jgi:hypothetical protein
MDNDLLRYEVSKEVFEDHLATLETIGDTLNCTFLKNQEFPVVYRFIWTTDLLGNTNSLVLVKKEGLPTTKYFQFLRSFGREFWKNLVESGCEESL